jgi:uncharacterized membrane protein YvlD (DUF360 family)
MHNFINLWRFILDRFMSVLEDTFYLVTLGPFIFVVFGICFAAVALIMVCTTTLNGFQNLKLLMNNTAS